MCEHVTCFQSTEHDTCVTSLRSLAIHPSIIGESSDLPQKTNLTSGTHPLKHMHKLCIHTKFKKEKVPWLIAFFYSASIKPSWHSFLFFSFFPPLENGIWSNTNLYPWNTHVGLQNKLSLIFFLRTVFYTDIKTALLDRLAFQGSTSLISVIHALLVGNQPKFRVSWILIYDCQIVVSSICTFKELGF